MTTKATEAKEMAEKSQEFLTKNIANSEKVVESIIEFNAAVFKGGEAISKKMYDMYITNMASTFDGVKALNKTNDVAEFYKVASANASTAAERYTDQLKGMSELSAKVIKETSEAGRLAYTKSFSVSL